jgi:hypothetical protein
LADSKLIQLGGIEQAPSAAAASAATLEAGQMYRFDQRFLDTFVSGGQKLPKSIQMQACV